MKKIFLLLFISATLVSCKKQQSDTAINCDQFKQGIIANSEDKVKAEIEKLCQDLLPVVTATDEWGHRNNFIKLAQRMSQQCGIEADVDCYACIKTLPPQTEIVVSFMNNGVVVKKTLDITTSSTSKLAFLKMHD
jgi:hypothetical protein